MTKTEQNLRLLILKAIELGYTGYINDKGFTCWVTAGCGDLEVYNQSNKIVIRFEEGDYSINDLVLNGQEGELSFLEALCKPTSRIVEYPRETVIENDIEFEQKVAYPYCGSDNDYYPLVESTRLHWVLYPVSRRVSFLFQIFSHFFEEKL